jgi:transposase
MVGHRRGFQGRADEGSRRGIGRHFDGIVAWMQTRQTDGFIEALNGLFQAVKRKARCYT